MRLQNAIFDMDGTLLDSMFAWKNIGPSTLRRMGVTPEPNLHEVLGRLTTREGAQYCKDRYRMPQSVEEIIAATEDQVEAFYRDQVQAKPGVERFLMMLRMEGVSMYVATNTNRHLVEIGLRHAGIDRYFKGILTCAEVGAGKAESPEVYERAMRRMGGNKRNTVVFEDAVHAIRTAAAAGFRICAVYDPTADADQAEIRALSEFYIRSFEELTDVKPAE